MFFNQDGWNAIFYAAEQGYSNVVQLLMDHGVALEPKDRVWWPDWEYVVVSFKCGPLFMHEYIIWY